MNRKIIKNEIVGVIVTMAIMVPMSVILSMLGKVSSYMIIVAMSVISLCSTAATYLISAYNSKFAEFGKDGTIAGMINGAGSAGIAIGKHLMNMGVKHLTFCDRFGIIYEGNENNNPAQEEIAKVTNREMKKGTLADAIISADVFIGVSAPNVVTPDMVKSMAADSILFPMANPTPEIMPDLAKKAGARVVGTGRSDFPNQINNVLAFPGIFRGALDCRATSISEEMKVATSYALASLIPDDEINEENIIASALDKRVAKVVAEAVAKVARDTGVARI